MEKYWNWLCLALVFTGGIIIGYAFGLPGNQWPIATLGGAISGAGVGNLAHFIYHS